MPRRRLNVSPLDLIDEMNMHIQQCHACGTCLREGKGSACPIGYEMAVEWLTYSASHGSNQAQQFLDQLREKGKAP